MWGLSDIVTMCTRLWEARRWPCAYRYTRLRWHMLFTLIDLVGWCLWGPARWLKRQWTSAAWQSQPTRRILVVQLDHLGDAVLSTGMLRGLRNHFPAARIDVLAAPWNREVFEHVPEVDRLMISPLNRFARHGRAGWLVATIAWGLQLRQQRYDLAIDVRGEFPLALMLWLSGARERLGWDAGGGGFLLTASPRWEPHCHEVVSRALLLGELGSIQTAAEISPMLEPTADAEHWFVAQRVALPPAAQRGIIALHLGSGMPAKRWPTSHWAELIGRLIVESGPCIVLLGGTDATHVAAEILAGKSWPGVVDWTGQLSIAQLAAVLAHSQLMIGGDSGPAHLAASLGTPVLALFSGTNHPGQWRPWGKHVEVLRHAPACAPCHREVCPFATHDCMTNLHPVAVAAAARHMWHKVVRTVEVPSASSSQKKTSRIRWQQDDRGAA